jgi:NAD(P)-dependent dehydrogenase (short-subunit alcohol dehydrogenase family)
MKLPERTRAVVTGAGSGLGRALCLALARRRGRLVVSDIDLGAAEETARLCREAGAGDGGDVVAVRCDVASLAEVEQLRDRALEALGGVDLVVNNAGVGVGGEVGETPIADWKHAIDINLWGVVHGCHAFVPVLKRQGSGAVLNVASAAGLVSSPHMAPYNATKAAVVALSETMNVELAARGIGVTVLCPTFFPTNILRNARSVEPRYERFASRLMGRSALDAASVADLALAAVERGDLYAVPMRDGRWIWRLKRLSPALYARLSLKVRERIERQLGCSEAPRGRCVVCRCVVCRCVVCRCVVCRCVVCRCGRGARGGERGSAPAPRRGLRPLHPQRGAAPAPRPREKGLGAPSLLAISHPAFVHFARRTARPHAPWGPRVHTFVQLRARPSLHNRGLVTTPWEHEAASGPSAAPSCTKDDHAFPLGSAGSLAHLCIG